MYAKEEQEKRYNWEAGSYLRLSREDGDRLESDSIATQRELISDYAGRKGIRVAEEYVDDGFSGANFERPGFKKMMADMQEGKINCIIVKDLSRLGRNYIETGRYIERIFPFMDVRFIAINDHYDSMGDASESDSLIVPFKNLINDAYCRDMSVKTKSHLDIKRRSGKFIGSFAPYGYKKDPKDHNHLVIDEYAGDVVKNIFRRKLEGMNGGHIAEQLNAQGILSPLEYKKVQGEKFNGGFRGKEKALWSTASVRRILTNELYIGTMVQGKMRKVNYRIKQLKPTDPEEWIKVGETHEPLIKTPDFYRIQELLEMDTRTSPKE